MAVAYLKKPYVANIGINVNSVYSASPFRPYAGFNFEQTQYQGLMDRQIIRAISSPFSVNDQNVINAIRRQQGFVNDGRYELGRSVGFGVGAVVGAGVAAALYTDALVKLGGGIAASGGPVGWGVGAALVTLGIIGTVITSAHLGQAIGGAVASPEGSYAMQKYLSNLGNSLIRRPVTTVLNSITMMTVPAITGIRNPYITQGITMVAMKGSSWIGGLVDDHFMGKMSEDEAMGYTDLLALQGDLADDFTGTSILKAIAASGANKDNFNKLLAKAYGVHEEGFDPLDFSDVREAYNVDFGSFGNLAIDMLGEILIDADNFGNAVKRKTEKTTSQFIVADSIEKIINDPVKLKEIFGDATNQKIINQLGSKKLERAVNEILKEIETPKKNETIEEAKTRELKNKIVIQKYLEPIKTDLKLKESEPGSKDYNETIDKRFNNLREVIFSSIQENIFKIQNQNKVLGEIAKKATENKNKFNPDTALLKEFHLNKFKPDSNEINRIFNMSRMLKIYSDANDTQMNALGYFTRPFQSIIKTKMVRKFFRNLLTKTKNYYDPLQRQASLNKEQVVNDPEIKKAREKEKEYREKVKEYIEKQKDIYIKDFILKHSGYEDYDQMNNRLNQIVEEIKTSSQEEIDKLIEEGKALEEKFIEMRKKILKNFNKTKIGRMLKAIDSKYKELVYRFEELEDYGKKVEYTYRINGKEEKRSIHDAESYTEARETLKMFEDAYKKTPNESIKKEMDIISESIKMYEAQKYFKETAEALLIDYYNVLEFAKTYEIQYAILLNAFERIQQGYNKITKSEYKKEKSEKVQEQNQEQTIQDIESRASREIEIERQVLKELDDVIKQLGLPDEIAKKLLERIKNKDFNFYMHPASTIFGVLKLYDDEVGTFFNNNSSEFDYFNNIFLSKKRVISISSTGENLVLFQALSRIETYKNKNIKNLDDIHYKEVKKYLLNLIENSKGLNADQKLTLIENIEHIISSWVHIAKSNYKDLSEELKETPEEKINSNEDWIFKNVSYQKDFGRLNDVEMKNAALSFVVNHFMKEEDLKSIDDAIKRINDNAVKLKEDYKDLPNEKNLMNNIGKTIYGIKNSQLLYSLNSKYRKTGYLNDIFKNEEINMKNIKLRNQKKAIERVKKIQIEKESKAILDRFNDQFEKLENSSEQGKEIVEIIKKSIKVIETKYNVNKSYETKVSIFDIVKNVLMEKGLSSSEIDENLRVILKEIFDIETALRESEASVKKLTDNINKEVKDKNKKINPLLKLMLENDILNSTVFIDLSTNRRGTNKKASDKKIDLTQGDGILLLRFMEENKDNINELTILKMLYGSGNYFNSKGKRVRLRSLNQLPMESVPNEWWNKAFNLELNKENKVLVSFLKGEDINEELKSYQEKMINFPVELRHQFEKEKTDFDLGKKIDDNNFDEITKDFGHIEKTILKELRLMSDEVEILNRDGNYNYNIKDTNFIVVNIKNGQELDDTKKDFLLFIPVAKKEFFGNNEVETYRINGQTYLRRKLFKDTSVPMTDIFKRIFSKDLERSSENFVPYLSNRSLFHLYYGNTPLENSNEMFSNLLWLRDDRTPMADIILGSVEYLTEAQRIKLMNNEEEFKKELGDDYDLFVSQSAPTFILKKITLEDGSKESILKIYNVGWNEIEDTSRYGIGVLNSRNAHRYVKKDGTYEEAILQNKIFKDGKNAELVERGGFNARTLIINMNEVLDDKTKETVYDVLQQREGASTFEDGIVMSESAHKKYMYDKTGSRPTKIVDRYSNKGAITVVSDKAMEYIASKLKLASVPEVLISEHGISKRDTYATLREVQLTSRLIKEQNIETIYVESGKLEHLPINSVEDKYGYLYFYKMEIGEGKSKATDTKVTRNSMSVSHEDLQTLIELKYVKMNGEFIDKDNILFNEIKEKAVIYEPNDDYQFTGKDSIFSNQFKWHLPHSTSMVIRHNSRLKPHHISIPVKEALSMGIAEVVVDKNGRNVIQLKKAPGADQFLIVRRPTKGRESFVYARVVLDYDPNSFAIGIGAAMTAGPNADFDYDNMQGFSLMGFSKEAMSIAEKAFKHDYTKNVYDDMNEETMQKYNMNQEDKDIVLKEDNNKKVDPNKTFETFEPSEVIFKTNYVKKMTPLVRDFVDVLYDQFIMRDGEKPSIKTGLNARSSFDWLIRREKISNEFAINFLKSIGIEIETDIERVNNFENLRRMILDSTTQITVDFGKHGNLKVREMLDKIMNTLFKEKSFKKQLILSSYIFPNLYLFSQQKNLSNESIELFTNKLLEYANQRYDKLNKFFKEKEFEFISDKIQDFEKTNFQKIDKKESKIKKDFEDIRNEKIKEILDQYGVENTEELFSKHSGIDSGYKHTFDLTGFSIREKVDSVEKNIWDLLIKIEYKKQKETTTALFDEITKIENGLLDILKKALHNRRNEIVKIEINGTEYDLTDIFVFKNKYNNDAIISKSTAIKLLSSDNEISNNAVKVQFDTKIIKILDLKTIRIKAELNEHFNNEINNDLLSLYDDFLHNVKEHLAQKHIERRVSLSQTLQGKIIFEHGIIQNILNDIYNGTENTYIGVLIKEMDDEKGFLREEMTKLLKDFYVYQKIFSIVDGSNRTSLANEIITIPGIFNSDIKFNNNDPKEIVKMLIDTGFIEKGQTLETFKHNYGIGNDELQEYLDVIEFLRLNLRYTKYGINFTKIQDYDGSKKLLQGIVSIRRNIKNDYGVLDDDPLYNKLFTSEDIINIKKTDFSYYIQGRLQKIINKITDEYLTFTHDYEMKDLINKEVIDISMLKDVTSLATAEFIKQSMTDESLFNQKDNPLGIYMENPSISTYNILVTQSKLNKRNSEIMEELQKVIPTPYKATVDSPLSRLSKRKYSNDISTLDSIRASKPSDFSDELFKEIENQESLNIPNALLNLLYHSNLIYSKYNDDLKISYIELINILKLIKNDKIVYKTTEDGVEVEKEKSTSFATENFARELFANNEEVIDLLNEFRMYLENSGIAENLGREALPLAYDIIGRIIFERQTLNSIFNKDPNAMKRSERMKLLNEDQEKIHQLYKEKTNNTSYTKKNELIKGKIEVKEITKNEAGQENIKTKLNEYIERPILEKNNDDIVDTYEITKYFYDHKEIKKLSLFALYQKVYDFNFKNNEEIEQHMQELFDEIVSLGFKPVGLPKLHTALIDAYINFKLIEKIAANKNLITMPGVREIVEGFNDLSQRKNFVIFDTENIINNSKNKRFYELSYITFNEDGKPIFKQIFFPADLNDDTIKWLKENKGWSNEELGKLQSLITAGDFKKLKKELSEFVELIKDKKIVGQAVKSNEDGNGEIEKINSLLEHLYGNDLQKVIDDNNEDKYEFLNDHKIGNEKFEKYLEGADTPEKLKRLQEALIANEAERIEALLNAKNETIYREEYLSYQNKITSLYETIIDTNDKDIIIDKMKYLFELSDEEAEYVFNIFNLSFDEKVNEKYIFAKVPYLETIDGITKIVYKENKDLVATAIEYKGDAFSNMIFKKEAFNSIREYLTEVHKINIYNKLINANNFRMISKIDPQFDELHKSLNKNYDNIEDGRLKEAMIALDNQIEGTYNYYHAYYEASRLYQKSLKDADDIDTFLNPPKETDKDYKKKVINTPEHEVHKMITDHINEKIKKLLNIEDKQTPEFKNKVNKIIQNIIFFDFENNEIVEIELLGRLLGITDLKLAEEFYNKIKETYLLYKSGTKNISFKYADGTEHSSLSFDETLSLQDLFKQTAFRDVLYGEDHSMKYILEDEDQHYKEYIEEKYIGQEALDKEIERINGYPKGKVNENKNNADSWNKERRDFNNKLLDAALNDDWESVKEYINKNKSLENGNKVFEEFKLKFETIFNELKKNGIKNTKFAPQFNKETNQVSKYSESTTVIKYSEEPQIKSRFIKKAIGEMYKEISDILYSKNILIASNVKNKTKKQKFTTYKEYNKNPDKFLYSYDKVYDTKEFYEKNKTADNFAKARYDKLNRLRSYQYSFDNLTSRFKSKDSEYGYDVDALWEELQDGYLGKNFEITIIENFNIHERSLENKREISDDVPDDIRNYLEDNKIHFSEDFSLKVVTLYSKEDLKKLLLFHKNNPEATLGLTTKFDMLSVQKINYSSYEMPRQAFRMYNAIVGFQKFAMLLNPGFIIRNIMDAIQRNYALVFQNGIIQGPIDFYREGKRTIEIESAYNGHMKVSLEFLNEIKFFYDKLKASWDLDDAEEISNLLRAKIDQQIDNMRSYQRNILNENDNASLYKRYNEYIEKLETIYYSLMNHKSLDQTKFTNLIKNYANNFMKFGFLTNIVMENKTGYKDLTESQIEKIKDEMYFMNILNNIEKSGAMSDRYASKIKEEVYDAFEEEIIKVNRDSFVYDGLDKLYNSKWNFMGAINGKIERWQRIHGILLDMRINGLTKIEAYNNSLRRFFNYGEKSNLENATNAYFPFASFAIRNLDYSLDMLSNMKYMRLMTNVMQAIRAMYDDEEEKNAAASPFYHFLMRTNGWLPLTSNTMMKTSNALFEGMDIIDNPFDAGYQKLNPMIQALNNVMDNKENEALKATGFNNNLVTNAFKAVSNIFTGNVNSAADIEPSLFYEDSFEKYIPRSYRTNYGDYRNLQRDLFFPDGSRRVPSRNPYTTAKNILYKNFVNARLMNKYRRNR